MLGRLTGREPYPGLRPQAPPRRGRRVGAPVPRVAVRGDQWPTETPAIASRTTTATETFRAIARARPTLFIKSIDIVRNMPRRHRPVKDQTATNPQGAPVGP